MDLAGLPSIQLPDIGSQTDIQALQQTVQTLREIEGILSR